MSGLGFESVTSLGTATSIAKTLVHAERAFDKAELKLQLVLMKLDDLRKKVVITDTEFDAQKKRLLQSSH